MIKNKKDFYYEEISEMPIINWNKQNEYEVMNSGVGAGTDKIQTHLDRMTMFTFRGMEAEYVQQRKNLHQSIWNTLRGVDFEFLQLMCFNSKNFKTDNEAYQHISVPLEKNNDKAAKIMAEEVVKITKRLDIAISRKDTDGILSECMRMKPVLTDFCSERAVEQHKFDKQLFALLKKKFNISLN